MRISYNWLKQYVDIVISPEELAEKLTMAGLEVEKVEYLAEGIEKVIVGRIEKINPHPNADKLLICTINAGEYGNELQIVTGASNVAEGNLVPAALVGAILPNGLHIRKANFRGVPSFGMLCSAEELNLNPALISPEDKEGIMILGSDATVGTPVTAYLGLEDYVLQLDLTPNRSDCLSMLNVAREVAASTGSFLNLPTIDAKEFKEELNCSVTIEGEELCNRYVALMIDDIQLEPSPRWMQQRLLAGGMRPINNVVDVTNFVMLETGQPLHAFDYETLNGQQIVVRLAQPDETITTLDGVIRRLEPEMLVIADKDRAVGIAGVMGGLNSEVTSTTKTVLLESAHFDNMSIRKTARKLGLRSEASSRFEKGIDREGTLFAAFRAMQLLEELGAGRGIAGKVDAYPVPWVASQITLRTSRTNQLLGTDLKTNDIKRLLAKIKLEIVEEQADEIKYLIPSYRQDITREVDLIEEVARLYGYNHIPLTLPKSEMSPEQQTPLQKMESGAKNILANLGLMEVVSYSFINPESFGKMNLSNEHPWRQVVKVANPLSEEQSVMRTTLIPGLLTIAEYNLSRKQTDLGIFEVGRIYRPRETEPLPEEPLQMAVLMSGKLNQGWSWPEQKLDFYYLKGIVQHFMEKTTRDEISFVPQTEQPVFHPGRGAQILWQDRIIGEIGELHPDVNENYNFRQRVYLAYIDLELIIGTAKREILFQPMPKYPNVVRDMAVLVPDKIHSQVIEQLIKTVGGDLVAGYELFDVYRGPQIADGLKSLAYEVTYQAQERTLTDGEVNELHEQIKEAIKLQLGADFR